MRPIFAKLVSTLILLGFTGCSSLVGHSGSPRGPYPGVRLDLEALNRQNHFHSKLLSCMDIPFSAALDTLFWPADFYDEHSHYSPNTVLWIDEKSRIRYCFVIHGASNWPTTILISSWSGPDDERNYAIRRGRLFFRGLRVPPCEDGQAWLGFGHSLTPIQLYPGDVVSNEISIAAAPTAQLIQRIVKMRSELEKENESK